MDHPLLKGGELIVSVACLELSIDGRHSNGGFLVGGWLFWTAFWCCTKRSKILGTTTFKEKSSLEVTWKHSKMIPKMGWYPNLASFPQPSVRSQSFTSLQIDVPRMVELNSSKGMSQLARKVMKIILQSWTSVEGCKVPGNHTRYKSWMDIYRCVFLGGRCLKMSHEAYIWSSACFCSENCGNSWKNDDFIVLAATSHH